MRRPCGENLAADGETFAKTAWRWHAGRAACGRTALTPPIPEKRGKQQNPQPRG